MESVDLTLILISLSTSILIAVLTYYLYRAAKLQFVASLTTAFQDQWHSPRAVLMRDYLHSEEFRGVFDKAIYEAYGNNNITYNEIERLLDESELKGNDTISNRLKNFDSNLKEKYLETLDYTKFPFSAYQALYEVLLSFDRLALFRDDPYMMDKCIRRYRPPIRDLSIMMQAFIAVRITLRETKLKNYKKDYMHLLGLLFINEPIDQRFPLNGKLFDICKEGLIGRNELSSKEESNWEYILEKRHEYPYPPK